MADGMINRACGRVSRSSYEAAPGQPLKEQIMPAAPAMTVEGTIATATGLSWLAWVLLSVLFGGAGPRAKADPPQAEPESGLFAEAYLHELDHLHAAISAAHLETRPGAASSDLEECWSIWNTGPHERRD
ncbi:hypothetical protein [Streptomyces sp. NPDC059928]|uniref:hypothetical protein n=1 Tax=unclassified Streptomyces TaxID=2593676 RepID=UPI003664A9E1